MPMQRTCVSVNGGLFRRFREACDIDEVSMAEKIDELVGGTLDMVESDPKRTEALVASIRSRTPNQPPIGDDATVRVSSLTWHRFQAARRERFPGKRITSGGSCLINAMLDAAGAK